MLLVGCCLGIRSEHRLCEEVHLNLAYRWFCGLDLSDNVPNHSTFSKSRPSHGASANDCRAMDVEATRSIRQAEVGSVRTMQGWLVDRGIAPHIPVIHCLGCAGSHAREGIRLAAPMAP
ncbi:hypothetical protein OAN307_c16530 [Octadecabacter antarcticus 307]|uniref:Transposase InsH N-terminal domain-containing protein n=1 Tax=Octadecabacter antarcticus 307 TaxID=391626 RepID=B5J4T1_9RHOB|nr:hypothetical protein OAN307_c14180 [Octadecabacter antarcticus 307]AGI67322.1 hypothetical protein OAN307_c16530 [Octadecabacter antarcticus 307]